MKKSLYKISGFSFFALGTIGIFLPILPTVPLYLLAILLLSRSSKKDIVKLKKLPFVGKKIYYNIKRSLKYLKKWNTQPQSSSTL
ncbi:MAG: YbaN family protein [Aquificaceae bacterium]|nr:YbaN family protein [Aquificaceae bacterium]MCS7307345.1 YbaN family protein [Aquificaceae bacterium]MCX8075580.1 YbaN family protein [Aquificaceae bacterium]MDW8095791.1 DUF454 family protein [Aquificaceae bacterium]MDW8433775.1 DUF454 family protein [Aquificaceae bacterium]